MARPAAATTFSDQFNGTSLSSSWKLVDSQGCQSPRNVAVSGGYLHLTNSYNASTGVHCGARIGSTRTFRYGTFQARIRFNLPIGSHEAFTMFGANGATWPRNGEFDIAEELGRTPNTDHVRVWTQQAKSSTASRCGMSVDKSSVVPINQQWHTYGVSWQPGKIVIFFDGQAALTYTSAGAKAQGCTWPFDAPGYTTRMYLAVSSGDNWAGPAPPGGAGYPATTDVDYVTVS